MGSVFLLTAVPVAVVSQEEADRIRLADFAAYPSGWEAKGGNDALTEAYRPVHTDDGDSLQAVGNGKRARIFKKILWDSKRYPVIEWKWKVTKWPEDKKARVALYVSLDKERFGIPTLVKYLWSRDVPEGTVKKGGFFRPVEVVVRSGDGTTEEWVGQRIRARSDFERLIGRTPKGEAYGIGLMVDSGVEAEIGEITAVSE
jgi:hypothetical protein